MGFVRGGMSVVVAESKQLSLRGYHRLGVMLPKSFVLEVFKPIRHHINGMTMRLQSLLFAFHLAMFPLTSEPLRSCKDVSSLRSEDTASFLSSMRTEHISKWSPD